MRKRSRTPTTLSTSRKAAVDESEELVKFLSLNALGLVLADIVILAWIFQSPSTARSSAQYTVLTAAVSWLLAAFRSTLIISNVKESFIDVLRLKEVKINQHTLYEARNQDLTNRPVAFTEETVDVERVLFLDLINWSSKGVLGWLVFGPGYSLIPNSQEARVGPHKSPFHVSIDVRGHEILITKDDGKYTVQRGTNYIRPQ